MDLYIVIMRWVIDSCTLILLHKSNLLGKFIQLTENPIIIDTSVYYEVVEQGIEQHYEDADKINGVLKENQIPIIPIDVEKDLGIVGNAGETSCYLLCKDYGVAITSDKRAYKKFKKLGVSALKLEQFFIQLYQLNQLTYAEIVIILENLESIWAIDSKRHLELLKIISEGKIGGKKT